MADRLEEDPTQQRCPRYETGAYAALVNAFMGTQQVDREEAIKRMKDMWEVDNRADRERWAAQQAENERVRQAEERAVEAEGLEEAARREKEKKKIKLPTFVPGLRIAANIPLVPSEPTRKRLGERRYTHLYSYTNEGCREAAKNRQDASASDALTLARVNGEIAFEPVLSSREAKVAVRDEDLTEKQFTMGSSCILDWMGWTGWPDDYIKAFFTFFTVLSRHPIRSEPWGDKATRVYAAKVRRRFHEQLEETGEMFDISEVNVDMLYSIQREIQTEEAQSLIEQMKAVSTI